ncbi:MAG: heat-inducible transcriptional repressor HrcA [Candidatus Avilachnospira sp.]|jgi:heat-inducible transcriptional repressor
MELDARKIIILKTIIKNYLETGEPVGSRTISKYSELNLSSATIRNEMSDLEEMGYIIQPHTSAGRIPSDKGYRFYVDSIMRESDDRVNQVTELMVKKVDKLEMLLKNLVKHLAIDTNYAALISAPALSENKIKYVQLSQPGPGKLLLILVLEGNIIKNEILTIDEDLDMESILNLTIIINNHFSGLSLNEITRSTVRNVLEQSGEHRETVRIIIDAVIDMVEAGEESRDIYTSGATNILKYPELTDTKKAAALISAFEEKDALNKLVSEVKNDETSEGNRNNLQVYIGGEGPIQNMQDCSLVTANYELGDGLRGVIGVIGPKRMDYEKVLGTMKNLMEQLDKTFGKDSDSKEGKG